MEDVHFSSANDDWATPQPLFDKLAGEFGGFDLDPCCSIASAKCASFFTKAEDGLSRTWAGNVFMNPPYGSAERACVEDCAKRVCPKRGYHLEADRPGIGDWVRKAWDSALAGATVVCLIPARTDASWWHDYAMQGEVRFLRGRIKFVGAKHNAPFPSAVVIFRPPA